MKSHQIAYWLFPLFFVSSVALAVRPYKIVIVSERGAKKLTQEFIDLMKTTQPFSLMGSQLAIEVVEGDPAKLDCKGGCGGMDRLICCNRGYAAKLGAQHDANKVLIATSKASGGAGGSVPIGGVGYQPSVLLHEMLHSFNLGDEYMYSYIEAENFCLPPAHYANVISIRPRPRYASDAEAKQIHGHEIPWFGEIRSSTLITTANALGTTPRLYAPNRAALYPGGDCNLKIPTWRPYYENNIMNNLNSVVIPPLHSSVIVKKMSAERGEEIKLMAPISTANQAEASSITVKITRPASFEKKGSSQSATSGSSAR